MIIVTGSLTAREDSFEALLQACLDHSRRSRAEPGCIRHNAYVDAEDPLRLFFYEEWADRAALDAHFQVPDSNGFMRAARALASMSDGPHILTTVD
ncbi:quinol monooxygenase YgiN [Caulobacter ginsengisoli]|uniref:Quinol monooxygenase YgiN n=1 Tax=Caulobacter ginsengisoli TaxID=400775 RepID=A0ABU0IQ49_9CAUL|nr:putative quinol monooxygenase [Caulobacter ginsengisoli]MDQ0464138.1 quinol monooxygenase YgiN [Caulobacter ginsengisoli]